MRTTRRLLALLTTLALACDGGERYRIGDCGCVLRGVEHFEACSGAEPHWEFAEELRARGLDCYFGDGFVRSPTSAAVERLLRCGCIVESIGTCGNYIEVDGTFVPLLMEFSLGPMPFCGEDDLRARVDGEVDADGWFRASTFALLDR